MRLRGRFRRPAPYPFFFVQRRSSPITLHYHHELQKCSPFSPKMPQNSRSNAKMQFIPAHTTIFLQFHVFQLHFCSPLAFERGIRPNEMYFCISSSQTKRGPRKKNLNEKKGAPFNITSTPSFYSSSSPDFSDSRNSAVARSRSRLFSFSRSIAGRIRMSTSF